MQNCCQLLPTKTRLQPCMHHCRRQSDSIPRGIHSMHNWLHNSIELSHCKVHVHMCIDLKNFHLNSDLDCSKYMWMPLSIFPEHIVHQHNMLQHTNRGFVYLEVHKTINGLPQEGMISNRVLKARIAPYGYYKVPHTLGLWKHISWSISFTLVVDDLGIKYNGREHAQHLINALKKHYTISADWSGSLYCGITLTWN